MIQLIIKKKHFSFPKMLDWLLFHTKQKFCTLAVDWLEDTHGQGWGTLLPPVWPGLNSCPDLTSRASLLVLYSASRGYSLGTSGFSSNQKPENQNLLCNCDPLNTQRLSIIVRITKFLANSLTSLLFLPHTSQPCLEPKLQFPLRHV